jgi:hypothetical protein
MAKKAVETSAAIDPDMPVSVSDGDLPAENMKAKSLDAMVLQMNMGFDVNGNPGNAGDWLVCIGDHWYIAQDL